MYGPSFGTEMVGVFLFIAALVGGAVVGLIWALMWLWPGIKAWLHAVTAA